MFFQTIYPMLSAGTDLSINIRQVNNILSVAVMPRHAGVKGEAGQNLVPLILSGTPEELDAEFLKTITLPVSRALGVLTNLETFEKQTEKASAQSKAGKTAVEKETKEAREKREKMERLLKKADEARTAHKYSEALTWLKQARALAPADKQKEMDIRMQEIQKQADAGSLFAVQPEAQPLPQPAVQPQQVFQPQQPVSPITPTGNGKGAAPMPQPQDGQPQMFIPQPETVAPPARTNPEPIPQPIFPGMGNMPQGYAPMQPGYAQPGQYAGQPSMYPPQMQPVNGQACYYQQPGPVQQQPLPVQNASNGGREYHTPPQDTLEAYSFDKDDESDRALLKEDPYAEYIDCPKECRVKDEAQQELVYC